MQTTFTHPSKRAACQKLYLVSGRTVVALELEDFEAAAAAPARAPAVAPRQHARHGEANALWRAREEKRRKHMFGFGGVETNV